MKHGDFTGLAGDYSRFRPGYAPQVANAILGYVRRGAADIDVSKIDAVDVGAGHRHLDAHARGARPAIP